MNRKNILYAIITILLVIICSNLIVKANKQDYKFSSNNVEQLSRKEKEKLSDILADNILMNRTDLDVVSYFFEKETFDKFSNLCRKSNIEGVMIQKAVDIVEPKDSSTGDTVIMANYKVNYSDMKNILFCMELHVNRDGKIYGYNIWAY